jgi:hypothetical protein
MMSVMPLSRVYAISSHCAHSSHKKTDRARECDSLAQSERFMNTAEDKPRPLDHSGSGRAAVIRLIRARITSIAGWSCDRMDVVDLNLSNEREFAEGSKPFQCGLVIHLQISPI